MGKWKYYNDNGTPCYLIMIIYKDMQTGERYAHSIVALNRVLNELCADDSVCDFKVFKRGNIEYEQD